MTADRAASPAGERWGLLDTQDDVWMGDDAGPRLYADEVLARLAAEVLTVQLDWPFGRIKQRPFTSTTHKRDNVDVQFTVESALNFLESDTMSRRHLKRVKP